ncbi:MAG TPA: DUF2252 domain-containing protein [Terriglobales bacterium]|nr:DUF2252 domain-containing protein [Terriglobales bacterium]
MIAPDRGRQERVKFGQDLRHKLKRSDQAHWDASRRKRDPIEIILEVNRQRIKELVPVKMGRMAICPFSFFRGSVPLMAADLATLPTTGIPVQICGDAHVRNLGAYAGPDGRLIFDINDFDETIRAAWEWDAKRLAASLVLAGREAGNSESQCRDAVLTCARMYRTKMAQFSRMTCLEVHKYRIHRQFVGSPGVSVLQRAERAVPSHTLEKITVRHGGKTVFKEMKPVLTHPTRSKATQVLQSIKSYRDTLPGCSQAALDFYRPVDVAFKIVGTGSVATHDYVVLHLAGEGTRDPLFLQIKEALQSAYAPYVKSPELAIHQGARVVHGQRMLQVQSDIMLGWTSIAGADYMVRQLSDHKASISNDDLARAGLIDYAIACGEVLAKGHARSGDPAVLTGYLGGSERWDKALAKFAFSYADQTAKDYEKFAAAIRSGKITAAKPCL